AAVLLATGGAAATAVDTRGHHSPPPAAVDVGDRVGRDGVVLASSHGRPALVARAAGVVLTAAESSSPPDAGPDRWHGAPRLTAANPCRSVDFDRVRAAVGAARVDP